MGGCLGNSTVGTKVLIVRSGLGPCSLWGDLGITTIYINGVHLGVMVGASFSFPSYIGVFGFRFFFCSGCISRVKNVFRAP